MSPQIVTRTELTPAELAAVRELIQAAPEAADNPPISERGRLLLDQPGRHLLGLAGDTVLGYAQLDYPQSGTDQPPTVELVAGEVGVAGALIEQLPTGYRLWAHGAASVAKQAAEGAGLVPVRTLLQLRRSLTGTLPGFTLPDGVRFRAFRPGQDDQAWLAVNARAFAQHHEQGSWTQRDLDQRLAASWFDAAGFLLAWQGNQLIGYHWTKVHAESSPPVGEVYVLGVDPTAQGMRLGTVLLAAGLRHLQQQGLGTVLLYVEQDNPAALRLYQAAGFSTFSADIQYAQG